MKYGWDKIKLVTEDLTLWDNLQVLWFDTCGFALIGKWKNEYWTYWDPLIDWSAPCWTEWNCPNCQPKISDIMDLPGWPEPCSEWDAFIALTRNWELKTICKSSIEDNDEKLKISSWDWRAWYLRDKLVVCNSNSPITLNENTSWSFHTMCIWWDPNKAKLKFTDLTDTPNSYESPALVYSNWWGINYFKPTACEDQDYSYIVYNKISGWFASMCPVDTSLAEWKLDSQYSIEQPLETADDHIIPNSNNATFSSTDDILKWNGSTLFQLTMPWTYIITCNSTIFNQTEWWLKAARWWLLVNGEPLWDAKYDSRRHTQYVNDEYPDANEEQFNGNARELELTIMSFNTVYIASFAWASSSRPVNIWFHVSLDTRVQWDPKRYKEKDWATMTRPNSVKVVLTNGAAETWPKTIISCLRVWNIPKTYRQR